MRARSSSSRSRSLASAAHALRAAPTWSEQLLWSRLSGSQLGVAFRRQVVLGRYIVDFAAPSVSLVVEVDGGYHVTRRRADSRRDRELERLGWRVLRLPAHVVEQQLEVAVAAVVAACGSPSRS
jgi:very-short-patch-repair endonuclease